MEILFYLMNYIHLYLKSELIKPYERSVLQLLGMMSRNKEKDIINTFKHNEKTYSTMKEKKFIPLYAEHIHFLLTRAGLLVTKIDAHCTFEQSPFKKEFVTMNQGARQKAETLVQKDFYKLMNNKNFGIDCRKILTIVSLNQFMKKIEEISFMKKYVNIFGNVQYKDFACVETMNEEVEQTFNNKQLAVDPNDATFEARKYSFHKYGISRKS